MRHKAEDVHAIYQCLYLVREGRTAQARAEAEAIKKYMTNRGNGFDSEVMPTAPFPQDGRFEYTPKGINLQYRDVLYKPGIKDEVWMQERDFRYLLREQRVNPEFFSKEMTDLKKKNKELYDRIKLATDSQWVVMKFMEIQQDPAQLLPSVIVRMLENATNVVAFKFAFTLAVVGRERFPGSAQKFNQAVYKSLRKLAESYLPSRIVGAHEGAKHIASFKLILDAAHSKGFIELGKKYELDNIAEDAKTFADSRFQELKATVSAIEAQVKANTANIGSIANALQSMQTALVESKERSLKFSIMRLGLSILSLGMSEVIAAVVDFSDMGAVAGAVVQLKGTGPTSGTGLTPDNFASKFSPEATTELARLGLKVTQFAQNWRALHAPKAAASSSASVAAAHPSRFGGRASGSVRAAAAGTGSSALSDADILDKIDEALEALNAHKAQTTGRKQLGVLRRINELDAIGKKLDAGAKLSYEERTTATQHIQFAEAVVKGSPQPAEATRTWLAATPSSAVPPAPPASFAPPTPPLAPTTSSPLDYVRRRRAEVERTASARSQRRFGRFLAKPDVAPHDRSLSKVDVNERARVLITRAEVLLGGLEDSSRPAASAVAVPLTPKFTPTAASAPEPVHAPPSSSDPHFFTRGSGKDPLAALKAKRAAKKAEVESRSGSFKDPHKRFG